MADDETRRSDFDDLDDAPDETASDALLPVGYPVRVTRAGEWLKDWAEILRVHTPPTSDNPTPTYDVLVKPGTELTTVSDGGNESVKDGNGNIFQLHSVWYVIRDKPYPSEVVELRPDVDPDDAKKVAEYRKNYAKDSWYRAAVADEKRRRSHVTVRVLRAGDVEKLASMANDDKPAGESLGVVDVSSPVDVNLYWMKDVLEHMKKFNPTVRKLSGGIEKSGAVWRFHTAKSRKAMATTSTTSCCRRSGRDSPTTKTSPYAAAPCTSTARNSRRIRRSADSRVTATSTRGFARGRLTRGSLCLCRPGRAVRRRGVARGAPRATDTSARRGMRVRRELRFV